MILYNPITPACGCLFADVPEDIKPLDIKQEPLIGTFGSIVAESVKSEASLAEDIKPKVEGGSWMESEPKAEADHKFYLKTEPWMKSEGLAKKEMKMEWMLPTDSKFIGQQMKTESKDFMEEKVEDLQDLMTKLEAMDPGLYKVISADMLRLHEQIYILEEELACKKKELAWKDDLIATKGKQMAELQRQLHALQPENEMFKEEMTGNSRKELENSKRSLNSQLDVPTTAHTLSMSITGSSSYSTTLASAITSLKF